MPWEMWPELDLKHFRHQKSIFWALESQFGVQKGELTCVLKVKITLFYCKMVNYVIALQFWAPKIVFWCDFRPILAQKLVKMVNFDEL